MRPLLTPDLGNYLLHVSIFNLGAEDMHVMANLVWLHKSHSTLDAQQQAIDVVPAAREYCDIRNILPWYTSPPPPT